jgi:hypothetical protein
VSRSGSDQHPNNREYHEVLKEQRLLDRLEHFSPQRYDEIDACVV